MAVGSGGFAEVGGEAPGRHAWIGQDLGEQRERFGIANAAHGLAVDALDQCLGGCLPVRNERPQAQTAARANSAITSGGRCARELCRATTPHAPFGDAACEPAAEPTERYATAEVEGAELVVAGTVPT